MIITIARPVESQTGEIRALLAKTIRHTFESEDVSESHAEEVDMEIQNQWDTLSRDFKSNGALEHFLIAKVDRRIVGTIAYGPPNKIIREYLRFDPNSAPEVKCVYVLPEFQDKGIGSRLFARILQTLKENGTSEFCLDSGYLKAQKFWSNKLGTPSVVLRDHWCPEGHHCIWLRTIAELKLRG